MGRILKIRKDSCVGCGLCAESCLRQAISIIYGQAEINQSRCNHCHLCLGVCPQDAIVELAPVLEEELTNTVSSLKQKTDDLIRRIEKIRPVSSTKR
jgi:ferredoxin